MKDPQPPAGNTPGQAGFEPWRYGPETYGDQIADRYDAWYASVNGAMIERLCELAGRGPALELGIGTGRVALPLAARGVPVHGIDASEAMIAKLREKPGGADIPVTLGSFASFSLDTTDYAMAFVVFNTLFALGTQDEQVSCFADVARHLRPGGAFVVDTFVPDVTRFERGQNLSTSWISTQHVMLECSLHDQAAQRVRSQHVWLSPSGTTMAPVEIRYIYPPEMDLMARMAGLELRERWASWDRAPYGASSTWQVAVYEKPA